MRQTPADDQYLYTAEELHGQIAVLLAGAVAEEIVFGSRSTGSAGDFEQAAASGGTHRRRGHVAARHRP